MTSPQNFRKDLIKWGKVKVVMISECFEFLEGFRMVAKIISDNIRFLKFLWDLGMLDGEV